MFNHHELRILYWNADGIHRKQQELADLAVSTLKVDIIALCETRLTNRLKLNIPGYISYRQDKHRNGFGQGVALMIRSDLVHNLIQTPNTENLETIGISLNISNETITIFSIYLSPNLPLITKDIDNIMSSGTKVIAMGDLNSKHPLWSPGPSNNHGRKLLTCLVTNILSTPPRSQF
ncbi:unnamed protein product [Leptidea sinapis]|uniref:Endonuclease/exonuclease/phosphatase domain-containing protein n=1 Tax=Leptidea sinapis TaxID=189913 RepID=A0A5E4R144_9NEOP|nr:unnamed protein product [Leptidea sinapis]